MSTDVGRRSRLAHKYMNGRRPKSIVIATLGAWLVITIISITVPLLFRLSFPVQALGQKVEPSFQLPSLSLCGPAQIVYVGDPVPVAHTDTCSPIRWSITVPKQIAIAQVATAVDASSQPQVTKHTTKRVSKVGSRGTYVAPSPVRAAHAYVARRQQLVSSDIHSGTVGIVWWLVLMLAIGTAECAVTAVVLVRLVNWLRGKVKKSHYGLRARTLMASATVVVFGSFGGVTMANSIGLTSQTTLGGVFQTTTTQLDPPPAGHTDTASVGASVGNSEVALYGGKDSKGWCFQSQDSLAAILTSALQKRVRNLACSGATIEQGLLGPQPDGAPNWRSDAQVGYLKTIKNLKFVIVTDGENEVAWSQIAAVCFLPNACNNGLSTADFQSRLTSFIVQYNNLLAALANLPTHPHVLINLSYDPFSIRAETHGLRCSAVGQLTAQDVDTMVRENDQLNRVLAVGAQQYGFATAMPHLNPFCSTGATEIQPVWQKDGSLNPYAFHPREPGEFAIALADYPIVSNWVSSGGS